MLLLEPYNPNWKQVTEKKASIFYHERPNLEQYKTDGLSLEKKKLYVQAISFHLNQAE